MTRINVTYVEQIRVKLDLELLNKLNKLVLCFNYRNQHHDNVTTPHVLQTPGSSSQIQIQINFILSAYNIQ